MLERNVTGICCILVGFIGGMLFIVTPPEKGNSKPSQAWAVTDNAKCPNPACTCEDCQCDPCECPCDVPEVNFGNKSPEARKAEPIIYFFTWETGCPGCEEMKPVVADLKKHGKDIRTIDARDPKNAKYVDYYGVKGVPQFITVDQKGNEIRRTDPGVVSGFTILNAGKSVLEVSNPLQAAPANQEKRQLLYKPQRTGWFRGRSVSACGPGGCN